MEYNVIFIYKHENTFAKYYHYNFIYHFYCVTFKIALRYIGMYIVIDYSHLDIQ